MDYSIDYLAIVKEKQNATRFTHTKGVMKEAVLLARHYKVDEKKAKVAAILHDVTKSDPIDDQKKVIEEEFGEKILSEYPIGAYHSLSGYIYAKNVLKIDDEDILNAIKNHTLGRPGMSTLEKIIFLADFIEPSRESEEAETAKTLAYVSLDKALVYTMDYVISIHKQIKKMVPKIAYDALSYYEGEASEQ